MLESRKPTTKPVRAKMHRRSKASAKKPYQGTLKYVQWGRVKTLIRFKHPGGVEKVEIGPKLTEDACNDAVRPASEDLRAKIMRLVSELLVHPNVWLSTSNPQFGGRSPGSLIGTEEEVKVYNLLSAADRGLF